MPKRGGPGRACRGGSGRKRPELLSDWPVATPRNWLATVNAVQTKAELAALRSSIARGAPFGDERWRDQIAERLGLEASLRPRGRPRKSEKSRKCPFLPRPPQPGHLGPSPSPRRLSKNGTRTASVNYRTAPSLIRRSRSSRLRRRASSPRRPQPQTKRKGLRPNLVRLIDVYVPE